MKLVNILEAKYHGNKLSQREREELVRRIYDLIPKADADRPAPEVYDDDDWRIIISFSSIDYYEVLERMTNVFGEPTKISGYEQGMHKENSIPEWTVKDYQIQYRVGYGDVDIEISKI